MSSHNHSNNCPICDNEMNMCSTNKPFEYTSGDCIHCGFSYFTKVEQIDLEVVNYRRKEEELKPLTQKDLDKYAKDIKEIW